MNQAIPTPLRSLCGVEFPEWLPVFDCRCEERAEYALGFNFITPVSIQGYWDTRDPKSEKYAMRWLADILRIAKEEMALWELIGEDWEAMNNGNGGSVCYKPVAVALSNYGACLICDQTTKRIKYSKIRIGCEVEMAHRWRTTIRHSVLGWSPVFDVK